jgi:glutamine synthetase type III
MLGLTAEKHDSFLEPAGDGSALAEFAGKTLTQPRSTVDLGRLGGAVDLILAARRGRG